MEQPPAQCEIASTVQAEVLDTVHMKLKLTYADFVELFTISGVLLQNICEMSLSLNIKMYLKVTFQKTFKFFGDTGVVVVGGRKDM